MKNILFTMLCIFAFTACNKSYPGDDRIAPKDDARIINAQVRDILVKNQRTYYNHEIKEVMIHVKSLQDETMDKLTVYVSPTMWTSMSPSAGVVEDWTTGEKSYTITSGDKTVTNVYTVKVKQVAEWNNHPWGKE